LYLTGLAKLYDVKVQLDKSLNIESLDKDLNFLELRTETQTYLTLDLFFQDQFCMLQTKEGRDVAVLNSQTFRSLKALSYFNELKYVALLGHADWKQRSIRVSKNSKPNHMSLAINISGPILVLDDVAKELYRVGLFLQPPQTGTNNLPYDNPQYLRLPEAAQLEESALFSNIQGCEDWPPGPGHKHESTVIERFADIESIIDEIPQHDYLIETATDFRIKTNLLR
jgi:SWI/SNF-related matrix-associated actin-dependent regulator of chromatin subfamily A3